MLLFHLVSAVVAHHIWDRPGGGELVMAGIAAAVEKMGLTPVLTSLTRFDGSKYREWFGIDLSRYPTVSGRLSLKMFNLYTRPQAKLPISSKNPQAPSPQPCCHLNASQKQAKTHPGRRPAPT